jgi:hypothetical protein
VSEDRPDAEQEPKKRPPEFLGWAAPTWAAYCVGPPSPLPSNCFFVTMQILDPPRPIGRASD